MVNDVLKTKKVEFIKIQLRKSKCKFNRSKNRESAI